jgi:uncharacterized protein (TIGR03382 family)
MKKILSTIVAAGLVASAYSQGQITFENGSANGYVAESSAGDTTANAGGTYIEQTPSFTATLWALSGPDNSDSGLNGLDAYGELNLADLTSDGFTEVSGNVAGVNGAFGPIGEVVPGTVSANTVFVVVCWTGAATSLAQAEATIGDYVGDLAFVNAVGPAAPSPITGADDIDNGWDALANSPRSAAEGGAEDLVMTQVTSTPEPTTLAFAGLGGLSVLLFRRRK